MKPPCKNCERRFVGCHSKCEAFNEYSRENEVEKEAEKLYRRLYAPSLALKRYCEIKRKGARQ